MLKKEQLELIAVLNKSYSNIILVVDPTENVETRIYIAGDFRENTESIKYFSITHYRDITQIINESSMSFNTRGRLEEIVTSIENTEQTIKERKFCDKFMWIKF